MLYNCDFQSKQLLARLRPSSMVNNFNHNKFIGETTQKSLEKECNHQSCFPY